MPSAWLRTLSAVLFSFALVAAGSAQQPNNPSQQVRSLNNQLLQVFSRLNSLQASSPSAATERSRGASVIRDRSAALEELIRQNPSQALSLAFSEDVLFRLKNAFPESASLLESTGEWEGPVEYWIEDAADLKTHRAQIRMSAKRETLRIHFASHEPPDLESGSTLRVSGVRVKTEVAAADGSITGSTINAAGAMCTPIGEQKSIVLLVNMPGAPPPDITPASVRDIFFANSGWSVSDFWRENSYGQAWAQGDVAGWLTLDANYTCDQTSQIRDAAIRAADSVVDFTQYSRIFIIVAGADNGCGWAGMGTVGCSWLNSPGDGTFIASTSWMLSSLFDRRDHGVKLAIHEGGHNLGLNHASSRDFGAEALGAPGVTGTLSEYGDEYSTMGQWSLAHYAAPHKQRLGWLSSDVQTVTAGGTFSIAPTETLSGMHALKVRRGIDDNNWLWVEYRNPVGIYDSTLPPIAFGGGLIHYEDPITGARSHLLDFTPETDSWSDPFLVPGKRWSDPYTNLSIAVDSASSNALNVRVDYGPLPCTEGSPTIDISPLNPSAYPGDGVTYTISVTNNDTAQCSPRTFNLSSLVPGWTTSFSEGSLTIAPATTASATMSKLVPSATPPATYSVDAVVNSKDWSVDNTANVTVLPACVPGVPIVNLSPTNLNVYAGDTAAYTLTVTNNDSAACAPRSFNLSSQVPAWPTAFAQNPLIVPASTSLSTTMSKLVPMTTPASTYTVDARISSNGWSDTKSVTVTVMPATTSCIMSPPAVSLSPSNPNASAGDVIPYTVSVTNNDSSGCSSRTFTLSSLMPAGWETAFSQSSLDVAPGSTGSATMSKTIPLDVAGGAYAINVIAANGNSSVEATAGVVVQTVSPPPSTFAISVSIAGGPFTKNSTVPITAKVTQNGVAAANATVDFKIAYANGIVATKKMTTDAGGQAVWSYKVGPKDPKGTYYVSAQAKSGSQTASSATTSFSVQ
jgi:M6 family metalloprotease-like protein